MAWWIDPRGNMCSPVVTPDGYDNVVMTRFRYDRARDRWREKPTPLPKLLIHCNLKLKRSNAGKNGPGILVGLGLPGLGIREDFKDAIEEVESGVHEFFPLNVTTRSGHLLLKRYYLLNIMQCFDALIVEKSSAEWAWREGGEYTDFKPVMVLDYWREPHRLVMSKPKIGGRHLWVGANLMKDKFFVSDALFATFKRRRLTPFLTKVFVEEIDETWDREANVGEYERHRADIQTEADRYNAQMAKTKGKA